MPERNIDHKVITTLLLISAIIQLALPFIIKSPLTDLFTLLSLILGVILFLAAYGLWNFKLWGLILIIIIYILNISSAILRGEFLNIIIPAVILIWLFQNKEKFK